MKYQDKGIIAIVGPTAVGKSALAVRLAKKFGGEVISADSRQVYRGLNVGTGKIAKREMHGVPHHLLDVADPRRQFSVAQFQKLAREKINEIFSRGKLPIICGGTGLYIDTLLKGTPLPDASPNLKLRTLLEKKSAAELFALLKTLDQRRAKEIDPHNPRRLVRAIEIAVTLGSVPSLMYSTSQKMYCTSKNAEMATLWIGLTLPPEELKRRISIRLFARIRQYLFREVAGLHTKGLSWKRMEALGLEYRYVSRYLRGRMAKREMIEKLQTEIWHYAKRQMTWFKRNRKIKWFSPKETARIETEVQHFLCG